MIIISEIGNALSRFLFDKPTMKFNANDPMIANFIKAV